MRYEKAREHQSSDPSPKVASGPLALRLQLGNTQGVPWFPSADDLQLLLPLLCEAQKEGLTVMLARSKDGRSAALGISAGDKAWRWYNLNSAEQVAEVVAQLTAP